MIDIDSLSLFCTLAQTLHFRKTSERHHLTPSALTRAIQRMETQLNVRLFERHKRSVQLTESGRTFYSFARQTLTEYEHLQLDLHPNPHDLKGSLKLYASVTAAYSILPALLTSFRNTYPQVTTYLETGSAQGAMDRLKKGDVDFAFGIIDHSHPKNIHVKPILETPLIYIIPKKSKAKQLSDLPLIFPEQGALSTLITQYLSQHKQEVLIHSYVEGHEAILAMVSAGLGAAVLPKIVWDHSHLKHSVKEISLSHPLPLLKVGLFTQSESLNSPIKNAFWTSA